jgi:hypothetical protein
MRWQTAKAERKSWEEEEVKKRQKKLGGIY